MWLFSIKDENGIESYLLEILEEDDREIVYHAICDMTKQKFCVPGFIPIKQYMNDLARSNNEEERARVVGFEKRLFEMYLKNLSFYLQSLRIRNGGYSFINTSRLCYIKSVMKPNGIKAIMRFEDSPDREILFIMYIQEGQWRPMVFFFVMERRIGRRQTLFLCNIRQPWNTHLGNINIDPSEDRYNVNKDFRKKIFDQDLKKIKETKEMENTLETNKFFGLPQKNEIQLIERTREQLAKFIFWLRIRHKTKEPFCFCEKKINSLCEETSFRTLREERPFHILCVFRFEKSYDLFRFGVFEKEKINGEYELVFTLEEKTSELMCPRELKEEIVIFNEIEEKQKSFEEALTGRFEENSDGYLEDNPVRPIEKKQENLEDIYEGPENLEDIYEGPEKAEDEVVKENPKTPSIREVDQVQKEKIKAEEKKKISEEKIEKKQENPEAIYEGPEKSEDKLVKENPKMPSISEADQVQKEKIKTETKKKNSDNELIDKELKNPVKRLESGQRKTANTIGVIMILIVLLCVFFMKSKIFYE